MALDDRRLPFTAIDERSFRIEAEIDASAALAVMRGEKRLAGWQLSIIADAAPTVAFASPPQATLRRSLELAYQAGDDYGLASVRATITREGSAETVSLELPLAGPRLDRGLGKRAFTT